MAEMEMHRRRTSKAWEPEEDELFLEILSREIIGNGKKLEEVYPLLEAALDDRTESACRYRFAVLRKNISDDLLKAIQKNNPSKGLGVRGGGGASIRSKLINSLQQIDTDLIKVDKDILDTKKRLQELETKKIKLAEQMQVYTEQLVRAATGQGDEQ
ncbi:hypothetical protein [Brevibacillus laterosporus]|uniref:hypothetical protein n=1 Tax=Brevibacillus laterosporus TaxID=1465 RepID=UPI003D252847